MKQQEIEIYFGDRSKEAELEFINRNYRPDVYVKLGEKIIQVNVYGIVRLNHDFEVCYEHLGYYLIEPNLILVRETDANEIVRTILELYKGKVLSNFKSLAFNKIPKKLEKVYPL